MRLPVCAGLETLPQHTTCGWRSGDLATTLSPGIDRRSPCWGARALTLPVWLTEGPALKALRVGDLRVSGCGRSGDLATTLSAGVAGLETLPHHCDRVWQFGRPCHNIVSGCGRSGDLATTLSPVWQVGRPCWARVSGPRPGIDRRSAGAKPCVGRPAVYRCGSSGDLASKNITSIVPQVVREHLATTL